MLPMETAGSILSPTSPPPPPPALQHPRAHTRSTLSPSKVPMIHDQASRLATSPLTTSIMRHLPSFLQQEQCDNLRPYFREDKMAQVTLDRRIIDNVDPLYEEKKNHEVNQYLIHIGRQLLYQPGFWYISPPSCTEEDPMLPVHMEHIAKEPAMDVEPKQLSGDENGLNAFRPLDALALAKRAMLASQEAANIAGSCYFLETELDESHCPSSTPEEHTSQEKTTVRSGRLLERRSKKRRPSKKEFSIPNEPSGSTTTDLRKKITKALDSNDPLGLFLWGPETKQLLTVKEERDLFSQIQVLMRIEEVKNRLHMQFTREPTLTEWAEAVGMSCQALQLCLNTGNRSRNKMIYANFRLVIHVAKQYQGKGLSLQDLLQVGSMGLMKSLEKFKPKAGCRFPTYAFWWIRQSIKKAIFQHSRTIRLPENVFALLKKIKNARMSCIQEGQNPTNKDLARRVGITAEKLEKLLLSTRTPVSIQQQAWTDQDTTFQEITADPKVETPDMCISKQMMRQHVRSLLGVLPERERQIIRLRYGLYGGKQKSLSDIGDVYGLSKERVRQLESRALDKLKGCLNSHGLEAYISLLT